MNLRLSTESNCHINTWCIVDGEFLSECLCTCLICIIGLAEEYCHISEELLEASSLAVQVFERTEELFSIHNTKFLKEVDKGR